MDKKELNTDLDVWASLASLIPMLPAVAIMDWSLVTGHLILGMFVGVPGLYCGWRTSDYVYSSW